MVAEELGVCRDEGVVMVEARIERLCNRLERFVLEVEDLDVTVVDAAAASRDGDSFPVVESCGSEAVESRRSDSDRFDRREI